MYIINLHNFVVRDHESQPRNGTLLKKVLYYRNRIRIQTVYKRRGAYLFERRPMFRDISQSRCRIKRRETKKRSTGHGMNGGRGREALGAAAGGTPLGVHNPRTMGAGARNNAVYKRRHNAGISETTNGLTADYRQMRGLGAPWRPTEPAPLLRPAARSRICDRSPARE